MAYTSPHTQALSEIADGIYTGTGKKDDPGVMKYHYVQIPRPKKRHGLGKVRECFISFDEAVHFGYRRAPLRTKKRLTFGAFEKSMDFAYYSKDNPKFSLYYDENLKYKI